MRTIFLVALVLVVGFVLVRAVPDIARYIKMRRM